MRRKPWAVVRPPRTERKITSRKPSLSSTDPDMNSSIDEPGTVPCLDCKHGKGMQPFKDPGRAVMASPWTRGYLLRTRAAFQYHVSRSNIRIAAQRHPEYTHRAQQWQLQAYGRYLPRHDHETGGSCRLLSRAVSPCCKVYPKTSAREAKLQSHKPPR